PSQPEMPVSANYRFETVGSPKPDGHGDNTVSVRLIHVADKRPISGAIIIESRADMSPIGMGAMTAPIKPMPPGASAVYSFLVANGAVWKKPDKWALTFAAKVQGEAQTGRGTVVVPLAP